ncbi:uncharacterized protein LOC122576639 [Bombus pyrosoma]|uniref:uncharacterized protein LOC122576639 n=1 Tax=Bombus pyrosoma TaxID=396416 RepID=UPI001CB960D8|nr:uncharacterized protein LOC122576639 [Bombus pyrosoma]
MSMDDMVNLVESIDAFKELLHVHLTEMNDLGEVKTYIEIKIEYDHKKCKMKLDQNSYIESLARQYDIENSKKLYSTPMEQNLSLEPAQSASDNIRYRNLIGALLYISTGTRFDVSYSVNYLSRFQKSVTTGPIINMH